MPETTDAWPKHQDGRPKKMGEMTRDEQLRVSRKACDRLKAKLEHPRMQEEVGALLRSFDAALTAALETNRGQTD